MIDGSVNGTKMRMGIDTGADSTMVSPRLADRLHLPLEHAAGEIAGLGGRSEVSLARIEEMTIGPFRLRRTRAVVAWDGGVDDDVDVFVGGNLLLQNDVELDGKQVLLFEPANCGDVALAYWADDVPWVATEAVTSDDLRTTLTVLLDGQPVRALVDTGAPTSMLDVAVARRLGFNPDDARSRIGEGGGYGSHTATLSTAVFDTFAIGPEVVTKPHLVVTDMWRGVRDDYHRNGTGRFVDEQPQMILGADFVRAHRLLFATSQRRLYFTYVGGPVFRAGLPGAAAAAPSAASRLARDIPPSARAIHRMGESST